MKVPRHPIALAFAFVALSLPCAAAASAPPSAPYESPRFAAGISGQATGAFHVESLDGRDWMVDPLGRGTFLFGVQSANVGGVFSQFTGRARYRDWNRAHGGGDAWCARTLKRLKGWGFNFLGHGCETSLERQGLAHAHELHVGQRFCADGEPRNRAIHAAEGRDAGWTLPDMFHPDFPSWCRDYCAKHVAPYRDDPWTVGWFVDNELKWSGTTGHRDTGLFDAVQTLPDDRPARQALEAFVAGRPVTAALKKEFLLVAARRYFEVTTAAVREADPNHLVLGCRFAGVYGAGESVWQAAGEFCDVVTVNVYPWCDLDRGVVRNRRVGPRGEEDLRTLKEMLDIRHGWAKKPLLISEWSFRALDSGNPNSAGAGQVFRTQAERARAADLFLQEIGSLPYVVGHCFFRWVDQPLEGIRPTNREDGNYGLVNERDEPYDLLVDVFRRRQGDIRAFCQSKGVLPHPAASAAPRDPQAALDARPAVVARVSGASYAVETGDGFAVHGQKGATRLFDSVTCSGTDFGAVGLTVGIEVDGRRAWLGMTNVVDAGARTAEDGSSSELRLKVLGGDGAHGFAARVALRFDAGRSRVRARLIDLANAGTAPFVLRSVYFGQFTSFVPQDGAFRKPRPLYFAGPESDGWIAADGRWAAATSYSPLARFRYWTDEKGRRHPDAAFYLPRPSALAPGARTADFGGPVVATLAFGFGGLGGWIDALRRL